MTQPELEVPPVNNSRWNWLYVFVMVMLVVDVAILYAFTRVFR